MKRVLVSLTIMGVVGIMLGACAYDPYYDGPYDRDYGPPPGAYGPPPPPPNYNAPPPGYDQAPPQGYAPQQLTRGQIARMNDPDWCNAHARRCAYFHSIADGQQPQGYGPPPGYNGQDQGPPPQGQYGPPQGYGPPPGYNGQDQGPPPQGYGPPPNYNGPPPGNGEANGPPQQMQQPQQ